MRKRLLTYGLLSLGMPMRLTAETIPRQLTWTDAVREAAKNNPDLAAENAALSKAEFQLNAARAPFLPILTGRLSLIRANSPSSLNVLGQTSGGRISNQYENSLVATQNIFNGFRDRGTVRQIRADRDLARWQLAGVRAQVSAELQSAFARLQYVQDFTALARQISERRTLNTRSVRLRYDAGREHKGSYLRTAADEASARFEEGQARRAIRVAQRELARVLGTPAFETLVATGTVTPVTPGVTPDFTSLAKQTPAVQRALLILRRADAGIEVAQSGFSPTWQAQVAGSRSGNSWPPDSDKWSIGSSISIPFFSGGSTWADRQSAVQEKKRAAFALLGEDQQIAHDLEETYTNWLDSLEKKTIQEQYVEAAQVRADIARGQYANGLMNFQDWDLIESDLIARQKSRLDGLRDTQLAQAAWFKALGQSDPLWKEAHR